MQRVLAVGHRIVTTTSRKLPSSRTRSATLVLRVSGMFSLKVKPITSTLASSIFSLRLSMALMMSRATKPAMPSLMRRPARIISG